MHDVINRRGRGIHPARRDELVARCQVRGWETQFAPTPGALGDSAVDEIVVPEQGARLVDTALGEQPPYSRAADNEILVANRIDLLGSEAVACAERSQHTESARPFVAE